MNSKTLTITLLILIALAVLWSKGRLQSMFEAALGSS